MSYKERAEKRSISQELDPIRDLRFSARLLGKVGKPVFESAKPHLKRAANDLFEGYARKIIRG